MLDDFDGDAPASGAGIILDVGAQLRAAREARGLSLAQVAAQTRIGLGNLERIEAGQFQQLPGRIYAIGFSKTYAKLVGLDQGDVAEMVRVELGDDPATPSHSANFEPGDPARGPSGRLVWFSILAVVVLLVGLFFAAKVLLAPAANLPSLIDQQQAEQAAANAAREAASIEVAQPVDARGAVVLTAESTVWLRLTDAQEQRLMEGELAAGQSFTIPANAEAPKLMTARPDMLAITVGGRAVPKISQDLRTVVDIPVDAASLLARATPASEAGQAGAAAGAAASNSAAPTPAPRFTPTSTATPRPAATVD